MNAVIKPGKGRHGKRATPDVRHSPETKLQALAKFNDGWRPGEVSKLLRVSFQTVYSWWAKWRRAAARAAVSDSDGGGE